MWVFVLYPWTKFEVSSTFFFGRYDVLSLTALIGLVTFTFWSLNMLDGYPRDALLSCQIWNLGFLHLSILELDRVTPQTDGQTDRPRSLYYNAPSLRGSAMSKTLAQTAILEVISATIHKEIFIANYRHNTLLLMCNVCIINAKLIPEQSFDNKLCGRKVRPMTRYTPARMQKPNFAGLHSLAGRGSLIAYVPSAYKFWSSYASPFGRYDTLAVSAVIGLVTLILTIWPWNWCTLLCTAWATYVPILLFLRLFVLDLWANTYQTVQHWLLVSFLSHVNKNIIHWTRPSTFIGWSVLPEPYQHGGQQWEAIMYDGQSSLTSRNSSCASHGWF